MVLWRMKFFISIAMNYSLEIEGYDGKATDFEKFFERGLKILRKKIGKRMKGGVIALTFISDKKIRVINRNYRGKNISTDVVSLSYLEKDFEFPPLDSGDLVGEIFISLDTAKRQAREHKKTLLQELQFLFVHGLLHIFGYDHEAAAERKVMFGLQDEVLGTTIWREIID